MGLLSNTFDPIFCSRSPTIIGIAPVYTTLYNIIWNSGICFDPDQPDILFNQFSIKKRKMKFSANRLFRPIRIFGETTISKNLDFCRKVFFYKSRISANRLFRQGEVPANRLFRQIEISANRLFWQIEIFGLSTISTNRGIRRIVYSDNSRAIWEPLEAPKSVF